MVGRQVVTAAGGDVFVGRRGGISVQQPSQSPWLPREQVQGGKGGEPSSPQPSRHFLSSHLCYLPFMWWQSGFKGLGAAGTEV